MNVTSQFSIAYRPKTWEEVYGQDVIVKTLRKRVLDNNFPKAILFQGKYGTGKTTLAHIFAAAMLKHDEKGNPDWKYPGCKAILEEKFDGDVKVLDGSQLGGKVDMVDFTRTIHQRPMYEKYKIYIIEEADQLSSAAMNALLKCLEDPSAYTHFILLSMNDKKGVPNAIKSRCQVFKVADVDITPMMMSLASILKREGLWEKLPQNFLFNGLATIAKASDGSMRMAVQHLEQCLTSETFEPEEVERLVGVAEELAAWKILDMLTQGSRDPEVIRAIKNSDATELYNYMVSILSEVMIYKETGFSSSEYYEQRMKEMASRPDTARLYYALSLHPQMSKGFIKMADLLGVLVCFYNNINMVQVGPANTTATVSAAPQVRQVRTRVVTNN